ncbi:hypothetical protein JJB99_03075 [Bradyrhizobium diazoefficiens]|uniref:hypothetical protein n=1 Tax=Bradyrhizobium diazoefficiens TaxID=1355477 RepID=UPI00190D66F4|nr:hypothetical protein [Bradyrhizobium diazoefficiens]QQO15187.1 hypothetical protein JJB99_03075 [Bradyrhizobium diazoefficiens]
MKTIGWAAIIYSIHDFWTLSALALLIGGELGLAWLSRLKKGPACLTSCLPGPHILRLPNPLFSWFSRPQMSNQQRNVQKIDVQILDVIRGVLANGLRAVVRTRKFKLNWWTGAVAAEETVTTVEPSDARH